MHSQPTQPGVRVNLAELIEMRHRVREVQLFSTPAQRSPLIGLHHSKLRGRGVDFDQVRVYQAGDDVRTIDWRVTARTQEPHTKLFHEERERPIYLLVEQSQRLFFGSGLMFKSVLAAQAASLIGWAALGHNDRIGGLVFGEEQHEIKPRRSKQSLLQLLNRLARANQALSGDGQANRDSFGLALRRAREVLRPGSLAVIICDERTLGDSSEQQLNLLARHTDLLLLPISDPLDHALPAAGLLGFAPGPSYSRGIDAPSTGFELDVSGRLRPGWQVSAGYTRLRIQNPDGQDVRTYVPRHTPRPAPPPCTPKTQ